MVYIKLELVIDDDGEETVCWSFHEEYEDNPQPLFKPLIKKYPLKYPLENK